MSQVLLYIHVLSAILMGMYLILPFLVNGVDKLQSGAAQYGLFVVLYSMNRVGQFVSIVAFLTGGYMVGKGHYSVPWMILAVVLFLVIAALSGIMGKRMRVALKDQSGSGISAQLGSIKTLALINGIAFFLIITIMKFPYMIG